jgi:PadR family transcriptional regulator, regulatory protein PadR
VNGVDRTRNSELPNPEHELIALPVPTPSKDRLHGTLDALVLKTLSWGPRHGYGISRWLRETSSDAIQVEEGSLYPALYRMEREGWIEAEWGTSELGRRVRFYKLTTTGRRQLRREVEGFTQFVAAVSPILLEQH